jgi:tRNA-Thr(GGU) m(6)t(6)A37 methyltransferase TsaA
MSSAVTLTPIAHVRSPYREKFGTPRQSGLVDEAIGEIHFEPDFNDPNMLRGLEQFSHLWLIYVFHATKDEGWKATVTPPRLGGTVRMGVFATRSNFRPNPLGLSLVRLEGIGQHGTKPVLKIRGLELLDGTPILDIKPYLPYADARPDATGGFASASPGTDRAVMFTARARGELESFALQHPDLEAFITALLRQDPRPAQHVRADKGREYGMFLHDLNIRWHFADGHCVVTSIAKAADTDE